jgi:hypothetical protein
MTTQPQPAVALVPGFFGFDHRQARTYFADRFVASLRSGLEARGFARVPVIPLSTLPIASLRRRQEELVRELTILETPTETSPRLGGSRRWHLVGHSTGGVDAALLLRDSALAEDATGTIYGNAGWGKANDLVERIRSVTSIAAPHFGSALAECPLARLGRLQPSLASLRDAAWGALDVVRRGDLSGRIDFARSAMPGLSKTLQERPRAGLAPGGARASVEPPGARRHEEPRLLGGDHRAAACLRSLRQAVPRHVDLDARRGVARDHARPVVALHAQPRRSLAEA